MPVNPAPAALRAFDILDVLAGAPRTNFSLAEIARRADLPRATCHSVLLALVERGFVVRHGDPVTYSLGPGCIRIGEAAGEASPLVTLATQAGHDLHDRTGLSTAVLTRQAGTLTVATATNSSVPFAAELRRGHRLPYVAPFGAAFAAWDPEPAISAWLDGCDPPLDDAERRGLIDALGFARRRGYSIGLASEVTAELVPLIEPAGTIDADRRRRLHDHVALMAHRDYLASELFPGEPSRVSQWSAPVFDHAGRIECILMMAGPGQPMSPASIRELGDLVANCARLVPANFTTDSPIGAEP